MGSFVPSPFSAGLHETARMGEVSPSRVTPPTNRTLLVLLNAADTGAAASL